MKAIWNGTAIAESDKTIVVEGNHYFPLDSVNRDFLNASDTRTVCPWKGEATYFSIQVDGETNPDAAWLYPDPKAEASELRDRVAFWRGVEVQD